MGQGTGENLARLSPLPVHGKRAWQCTRALPGQAWNSHEYGFSAASDHPEALEFQELMTEKMQSLPVPLAHRTSEKPDPRLCFGTWTNGQGLCEAREVAHSEDHWRVLLGFAAQC